MNEPNYSVFQQIRKFWGLIHMVNTLTAKAAEALAAASADIFRDGEVVR